MIADDYAAALEEGRDADLDRATLRLERAYLGACMTSGLVSPSHPLTPETFLAPAHGEVWRVITTIAKAGEEPDLTRVVFELARAGRLEAAGGAAYVASLLDSTDCSQLAVYARLIGEASRVRRMRRA